MFGAVISLRMLRGFEFPIPWNDETAFTSQAFEFSRTGSFYVYGLNSERIVMWMPPGFMLLLAGVYKIFGYSFELSRWVSSILYLCTISVSIYILRMCLHGWRRYIGLAAMLIAFLSPYSMAMSNVARMESFYVFLFMLSLLASLREKHILGLSLILLSATIHFNAAYFLLPYIIFICWKIIRREPLIISPSELLAFMVSTVVLLCYGLFVVKNIHGFWQDMQFQFAYKLGSPVMGGKHGWQILLALLCIPFVQLGINRWRFGNESLLSLYGIAFIAMTLNGHNMWYYFAFNFGFWLIILGVLASSTNPTNKTIQFACFSAAIMISFQLTTYFNRSTKEFNPLKPAITTLSKKFLPNEEIEKVRAFIRTLPQGSTVSFGYTGIEQFFYADLANAKVSWSAPAHSVTQALPARQVDYRVFCDSEMFPKYLSMYDWDGYPRKSQASGCEIIKLLEDHH